MLYMTASACTRWSTPDTKVRNSAGTVWMTARCGTHGTGMTVSRNGMAHGRPERGISLRSGSDPSLCSWFHWLCPVRFTLHLFWEIPVEISQKRQLTLKYTKMWILKKFKGHNFKELKKIMFKGKIPLRNDGHALSITYYMSLWKNLKAGRFQILKCYFD